LRHKNGHLGGVGKALPCADESEEAVVVGVDGPGRQEVGVGVQDQEEALEAVFVNWLSYFLLPNTGDTDLRKKKALRLKRFVTKRIYGRNGFIEVAPCNKENLRPKQFN
jgi:hypothetical protein